jgi:bacillithiol biosynthesis cysteine-adding enzyme BshC
MHKESIHREKTNLFSKQQLDLSYNQNAFEEFISAPFSLDAFPEAIIRKKIHYTAAQRTILCNALEKQYESIENKSLAEEQIVALRNENTFTITTGHQLSLFTGPLYFIYKILHVIRLSEELDKKYPENKFIPVYWMATEDHDFEEIQSIFVFNKPITWSTNQKGPVGRFDTEGLEKAKDELKELFANQTDSGVNKIMDQLSGATYGSAFRKLIHYLFLEYGLLIVDGDDLELKKLFVPTMEKELRENFSSSAVNKTNQILIKKELKTQVNTREINLFYIEKGLRERIIQNGEFYTIAGKGNFSQTEIIDLLHKNPQSFSPNVVLRPVYQETILPNLCYIGGTSEITYWLQFKGVFDEVNVPYPLILVRNSLLWIDVLSKDKMNKLNVSTNDLFEDIHLLQRNFVEDKSSETIDFSSLDKRFAELELEILNTVKNVDSNLERYGLSEVSRLEKQIQGIKEKLFKSEKQKHDISLKMMEQLKERLFPNNGLQERSMNLFQLAKEGDVFDKIKLIKEAIEPLGNDFIILFEE